MDDYLYWMCVGVLLEARIGLLYKGIKRPRAKVINFLWRAFFRGLVTTVVCSLGGYRGQSEPFAPTNEPVSRGGESSRNGVAHTALAQLCKTYGAFYILCAAGAMRVCYAQARPRVFCSLSHKPTRGRIAARENFRFLLPRVRQEAPRRCARPRANVKRGAARFLPHRRSTGVEKAASLFQSIVERRIASEDGLDPALARDVVAAPCTNGGGISRRGERETWLVRMKIFRRGRCLHRMPTLGPFVRRCWRPNRRP